VHNAAVAHTTVGRIGTVIIAIRGGDLAGEVRVTHDGIAHYYLAYAPDPIPTGEQVLIIHHRGARQVDVEPWPVTAEGQ
jgi:membrane protein implicated in regulation of membrane protease activity